ncbi:MAG: DUF1232 domain-containing protein [Armatimonadota bacterium]|nr:DUF1232 domain-containing protein [Armatimonadota bacterium]
MTFATERDISSAIEVRAVVTRLPKYAKLVWLLLKDPEISGRQRAALMAAIGYSVSPVDAIPGVIPVIGQLDDLAIVLFTVSWIIRSMPAEKASRYLAQADLSVRDIEDDLHIVQRSSIRIMKRIAKLSALAAVGLFGVGKFIFSVIKPTKKA